MCQQGLLQLHQIWPAYRTRWWAVLFHPSLHVQSIPPVPKMHFEPSIVHLLPCLMQLTPEEIAQLELSIHETAMFSAQPKGILGSVIDLFKPMPTATHSWGNQCQVPMGGEILSNQLRLLAMRHLHPQEVAILCGLFPSHVSPHAAIPLKLDLAGVGQLASPIQSTWICAQVMHAMGIQGLVDPQPTPHQRLGTLLKALLQERDQLVKRNTPTTSM